LYIGFISVSGFSTLALALSYRRIESKTAKAIIVIPLAYAVIMASAYTLFPPNPDKITIPMNLIISFRAASVFTIGIFWDKFKPDEVSSKIVTSP
jgi:hypothetical protein